MPLSENPAMTVPLIDGDKLDSFDPSKTVRYQLGHASTSNRITELERLLELGVHPRNEENIRVALQAYRHGELPRTDTTYVFIQFGVIIPHNQIEKINPGQPFWGEVGCISKDIMLIPSNLIYLGIPQSVPWRAICSLYASRWSRVKKSRY